MPDPVEIARAAANKDAVELAESLLARTKSGELQSICYVAVKNNLYTASGYAGMRDSRMATLSMGELHTLLTELGNIECEGYQ